MSAFKSFAYWSFSFVAAFYTTFVLTMLWDWFVTAAFHVGEIRYWNMYGLSLLVRLFGPTIDLLTMQKWDRVMKMIEACIPEDKRLETMTAIQAEMLSDKAQLLMGNLMGIFASTVTLVIGWLVHTFFMTA